MGGVNAGADHRDRHVLAPGDLPCLFGLKGGQRPLGPAQ
jgi:hypothetical protein